MREYCENEAFETYCEDMVEKQKIVHSTRNNRPHRKTPYMTRKEIEAMHGEPKIYNLNKPMSWQEFKAMPDDLKIQYVQVLRQRYSVSDTKIGEMLGISQKHISRTMIDLGIGNGREGIRKTIKFDAAGWREFVNGESGKASLEVIAEPEPVAAVPEINVLPVLNNLIPKSGYLEFDGEIDEIFHAMKVIIGCGKYHLSISFNSIPEERSDCDARSE